MSVAMFDIRKFVSRMEAMESENKLPIRGLNQDETVSAVKAWFRQYDPSVNGRYVKWMVNRYIDGNINRLEDVPARIKPALERFIRLSDKNKLREEHRDIGQIKDLEGVIEEYAEVQEVDLVAKNKMDKYLIDNGHATLRHESDDHLVVELETFEASKHFGVNTRWCTTSDDDTFQHYRKKGKLFVILHKPTNRRWQFSFATTQFMDELDKGVKLKDFFGEFPDLIPVFFTITETGYRYEEPDVIENSTSQG